MDVLTTVLEFLATASIVYGVFLVFVPAAFIVGGLLMFAISYGLTRARPVGDGG